jgi:hypothetical protein
VQWLAAARLIAAGRTPKAVRQVIGHRSVAFTLDAYGHLFETDLDDLASELVTGRVGSIPEEPGAGDNDARRDDGSSSDDPRRAVLHHRPLVPPNLHLDLLDDPPMRANKSLVASSTRAQTLPTGTSVKPAVIRSVRPAQA